MDAVRGFCELLVPKQSSLINMVDTRNISLGGLLFHVELPAYTALRAYLSDLAQVLRGTEGEEEVLQEVEHRFAELFNQFMADAHRSVVTLTDVEKARKQLGEPNEFREVHDEHTEPKSSKGPQNRRIYRDPEDKVISGACAGIAHRVGVDPILIRALFIALTIASGIGVLVYGILWVCIPKAKSASDRLAMKGDSVTLDAIKEAVEDQLLKAKDEFENPTVTRRYRSWWNRFISETLPHFLKGLARVIFWMLVVVSVVLFAAFGLLILSALITGHWNFKFMF